MKLRVFGVFAVLLLTVGAVSVNAQSGSRFGRLNVPFDFTVGNDILPKGEYIVTNNQGLVLLKGQHGSMFACTLPTEKSGGKDAAELVFHLVNNQYFLAEIWLGNDQDGRKLYTSKREREMTAQVGKPVLRILTASAR